MTEEVNSNQKKKVTQKDVAELAGVSPSIVSYVINDGPRSVSAETRQRVLDAIETLNYRPNKFAQMLMRKKWGSEGKNKIGIVLGGAYFMLQSPYYGAILNGIYKEADANKQEILFIKFWEALKDPITFNNLIHQEEVSGLLLISIHQAMVSEEDQQLLKRIRERMDNVICIERVWEEFPSVTVDLVEGARKATRHLIRLGRKKIAFVGNRGAEARLMGYKQALLEAGYSIDDHLMVHPGDLNIPEEGYNGIKEIIEKRVEIDAVFSANDEVAIGVLQYLNQNRISIPDDIAVVGFDNIRMAKFLTPSLTTIDIPKVELGEYAVRKLIDHSKREETTRVSSMLPTKLIIRDSCGGKDYTTL